MREYYKDPRNKLKIDARIETRKAIRNGIIQRKDACEVCSSQKNVEIHHPDYSKPLEVQFLCKKHHWQADQLLKAPY